MKNSVLNQSYQVDLGNIINTKAIHLVGKCIITIMFLAAFAIVVVEQNTPQPTILSNGQKGAVSDLKRTVPIAYLKYACGV